LHGCEWCIIGGIQETKMMRIVVLVLLLGVSTAAQVAVSSNDGKAVWVDGVNTVPANARPDTATILDLSASPPRVVAEFDVPGGWSARAGDTE
jgi:hypothetical protein